MRPNRDNTHTPVHTQSNIRLSQMSYWWQAQVANEVAAAVAKVTNKRQPRSWPGPGPEEEKWNQYVDRATPPKPGTSRGNLFYDGGWMRYGEFQDVAYNEAKCKAKAIEHGYTDFTTAVVMSNAKTKQEAAKFAEQGRGVNHKAHEAYGDIALRTAILATLNASVRRQDCAKQPQASQQRSTAGAAEAEEKVAEKETKGEKAKELQLAKEKEKEAKAKATKEKGQTGGRRRNRCEPSVTPSNRPAQRQRGASRILGAK